MKKSNFITFLSLCVLIVIAVACMFFWKKPSASPKKEEKPAQGATNTVKEPTTPAKEPTTPVKEPTTPVKEPTTPAEEPTSPAKKPVVSMKDSLFIGDSRTVGLMEYAQMKDVDFFANVGMSVYNIHKKPVSVPGVGKVTLKELLKHKKYGKIYIMLGVNEVGYRLESTVSKYKELIAFIQEREPDAKIIIQANLHVTKSRSDSDKVVNNKAIDRLNQALSELADGENSFYLDANSIFDDGNGNLASDKTADDTHLYAKYYAKWGKWIVEQTATFIKEG